MGKRALAGQPGVFDVVKALRKRPFGEWNVVYYDPAKTTVKKLQERLRSNGCKRATQVASEPMKGTSVVLDLGNPVSVRGDFIAVVVTLPKKSSGTVEVEVPKDWTVPGGARRKVNGGATMIGVQTPARAEAGRHKFTVKVKVGRKTSGFPVEVDLVDIVR